MNIEIKLDTPNLCYGCPCIGVASFGYEQLMCNLGYWDERDDRKYVDVQNRIRPVKCKRSHGE